MLIDILERFVRTKFVPAIEHFSSKMNKLKYKSISYRFKIIERKRIKEIKQRIKRSRNLKRNSLYENKSAMSFRAINNNMSVLKPNITQKLPKLRTICSNPIHKDNKYCTIFWKELKTFNQKVDELEYAINNDNFIFESDTCDVPENAYIEECRTYDL